jgi:hypothetical protein
MIARRHFLQRTGFGLGALAAADFLNAADKDDPNPLAPRQPHFPPKVKRVIHLFMNGGPSQIDTFDPKPQLTRLDGKPLPDSVKEKLQPVQKARVGNIFASPFAFKKHGQSGLEISELFPNVAKHADSLCVIRSMVSDIANHSPGLLMMNCGHTVLERPSIGSWVTYGLGSESADLPGYIVLMPSGLPTAQSKNWTAGFLPGLYQGTHIETQTKGQLIPDLTRHDIGPGNQRAQLALTQFLNRNHLLDHPGDERLDSRIHSMELAFRMQSAATDAFDLKDETEATRSAYGDTPVGKNLLLARRLAERGVRYIQTATPLSSKTTKNSARRPINPSPPCSPISKSAASGKTRSSSGAARWAAPPPTRAAVTNPPSLAAIIMWMASPSGSQAVR